MPFARIALKALIPKDYDFEPVSLGDHIRKKRLRLSLFQWEVAQRLEVNPWTVLNWEKGHTEPPISSIPAILEFLGYDPFSAPETIPNRLLAKRRQMGWTIKQAAAAVGVDPSTWGNWELGGTIQLRKHREAIAELLEVAPNTLDQYGRSLGPITQPKSL